MSPRPKAAGLWLWTEEFEIRDHPNLNESLVWGRYLKDKHKKRLNIQRMESRGWLVFDLGIVEYLGWEKFFLTFWGLKVYYEEKWISLLEENPSLGIIKIHQKWDWSNQNFHKSWSIHRRADPDHLLSY